MWARGLRNRLNDLDIVAKGPAWRTAEWSPGAATLVSGPLSNEPMVCFLDGRIEIASTWVTDEHCLDELIESADDIHGIPFARLDHVLESKLTLNRKKDQGDISILKEELNRRPLALAGC